MMPNAIAAVVQCTSGSGGYLELSNGVIVVALNCPHYYDHLKAATTSTTEKQSDYRRIRNLTPYPLHNGLVSYSIEYHHTVMYRSHSGLT